MGDNTSDKSDLIKDKSNEEQISKPTTLIMKGGGIKGLAYVGALEILTSNGYNFNWFAGTSAGAISAILMASGHSQEELKKILFDKDFNQFKDASILKAIWNLITKGGLYEARTFTDWIDELLSNKFETAIQVPLGRFKEKTKNRVTIFASRENTKYEVYDSNLAKSAETPAAFAARSSMAIPFFFTPTSTYDHETFDGGLQNNYPVNAILELYPGTKFIGLYLGPESVKPKKQNRLISKLISIWIEANDKDALRKYEDLTIVIDADPISTLDFSLTTEEKEFLIEGGRLSTLKFLSKRGEIELPIEYRERKQKHEILRGRIAKKRNKESKKKIIKIVALIVGLVLGGVYFSNIKNWASNYFTSYRTSIADRVGLQVAFLDKQNSSDKYTAWELVNSINSDSPCNFIPDSFREAEGPSNNNSLVQYITVSKNEVKIICP